MPILYGTRARLAHFILSHSEASRRDNTFMNRLVRVIKPGTFDIESMVRSIEKNLSVPEKPLTHRNLQAHNQTATYLSRPPVSGTGSAIFDDEDTVVEPDLVDDIKAALKEVKEGNMAAARLKLTALFNPHDKEFSIEQQYHEITDMLDGDPDLNDYSIEETTAAQEMISSISERIEFLAENGHPIMEPVKNETTSFAKSRMRQYLSTPVDGRLDIQARYDVLKSQLTGPELAYFYNGNEIRTALTLLESAKAEVKHQQKS